MEGMRAFCWGRAQIFLHRARLRAPPDFLSGGNNGTLCRITAVDVTTWNLIQVELTQTEPDYAQPGVTTYEVLHVSTAQAQPDRSA